jgi:hypothetical protein
VRIAMRTPPRLAAWIAGALILACGPRLSAAELRLTLSPAAMDRAGQVISFTLPPNAPAQPALLDAQGQRLPLQVGPDRTARFMLAWQAAGTSPTFTLTKGGPSPDQITVKPEGGDLSIQVGGKPAFSYRMDREKLPRPDIKPEYKRAGYLYPILTPSGRPVADDYPVQHVHHHGIWSPWTKTKFQGRTPDFWNMGQKTGTVEFVGLERSWSGPVAGGFVARHRMVDLSAPTPVVALHETWEVTAYHVGTAKQPVQLFELVLTQTCATSDPLILPEYHYGGLGFRGLGTWLGEKNSQFLTSNGETDRVKAHTSRVRWIHQYGPGDGGVVGLTMMDHPGNFRAPQPLRVHPKEPFICFAPSQLGDWSIEPGKPYVGRYRFIVQDGPPDRALLDAYWAGYAEPATVTLSSR